MHSEINLTLRIFVNLIIGQADLHEIRAHALSSICKK